MRNSVIIKSCQSSSKLENLERFFAKRGLFDFDFVLTESEEKFVELCKNAKQKELTIAFCENSLLDEMLEKIASEEDNLEILKEQAVLLSRENSKILFLPTEADILEFLPEFLPQNPVYIRSIFGKTTSFLEDNLKGKHKIFSKSPFLHTIYSASPLEIEGFSNSEISLGEECKKILDKKGLKLKTAEFQTFGGLIKELFSCLNDGLVIFDDFSKVGLNEKFIEENGTVSKQTALEIAKNLLSDCDIALCVCANKEDGQKSFVAVGDKNQMHIFSSSFYCYDETDSIVEFAVFKLLSFLKENYQ